MKTKLSHTTGASETIGFIVLISIAIITSIFIGGVASHGPVENLQSSSEYEQVKNSFSQISSSSVNSAVSGKMLQIQLIYLLQVPINQ